VEVKIVDFMIFAKGRAERELTRLVNEGWRIVAAGGGGPLASYIVVLQRGDEARRGVERPARG
jgi:hypothetical protein